MIYLTRNLSQAYDKLREINIENNTLRIYAVPSGYETIKIDINKTIEDLKYISSTDKELYLLEFKTLDTLKKLTELSSSYDWSRIFFSFCGENEYSIYSEKLTQKDYKEIIQKINKNYSEEEKDTFSWLYTSVVTLFLLSKNLKIYNDKKECIEKDFIMRQISKRKKSILSLVNEKIPDLSENIKQLLNDETYCNSSYLGNCFEIIKKKVPFFTLSCLKEKEFLSFLSLFHFVTKPLEKISYRDIEDLFENLCQIEKEISIGNLGKTFNVSVEKYEIHSMDLDYREVFYEFGNEKLNAIDFYFKKINRKFNLLKICAIEKIYRYISLNLNKYEDIKKLLKNTILEKELKVEINLSRKSSSKKATSIEIPSINNLWGEYLKSLEDIFSDVDKSFYFNDFFRMQLFYRKKIFENLSCLSLKFEEDIYEKIDVIKGNFKKLMYSEREIGQESYRKIISAYNYIISYLEKIECNDSSKINQLKRTKKNKENFIYTYMLLQRYKSLYDIIINLENLNDKANFIKYNNYIGLGDIYDFKINTNPYRNIEVLDMYVVNFSYQRKELNYNSLKINNYYIIQLNAKESKDIFLLQYIGNLNEKLLFRNNAEIKSYLPEEIKIREIKYLEFHEPSEKKEGGLYVS